MVQAEQAIHLLPWTWEDLQYSNPGSLLITDRKNNQYMKFITSLAAKATAAKRNNLRSEVYKYEKKP